MSSDCCGIGRFIVDYFQFPLSSQEAYERIKDEAKYTHPKQNIEYWKTIDYSSVGVPAEFYTGLKKASYEVPCIKRALIIGRISHMAILYLLKSDWRVTVVDPSQKALSKLENTCKKNNLGTSINNLSLVHQTVEDYKFSSQVDLILAFESFSYCNPLKFKTIWIRIHNALSKNGIIAGNFRLCPSTKAEEIVERTNIGAWYITQPCLNALLEDQKYEKELSELHTPLMESTPTDIRFIARKV